MIEAVRGFLGANGAGKTTTMRMLVGPAVPDAGIWQIARREVASRRPSAHQQ
jgi:ABC-type multidrug transport system ATPase subunit